MKKKILAALLSMLLSFSIIPLAVHATDNAPQVKTSGTGATFTADAPISTVRLDYSKINCNNLTLYHPNNSAGFRLDGNGYIYAPSCGVKSGYKSLGYFTLTFANAAILADGTRKNLVVKFDDVTTIGVRDVENYYETLYFAQVTDMNNRPLLYTPLSSNQKHVAIRSIVTFYVQGAGDNDTMLFAANSINTSRQGNNNFEKIVDSSGHYAYSESMEPLSGIADGSDLYLPENSRLHVVEGNTVGSYGVRFVGNGITEGGYSDGFATVANAKNGFSSRVWSSAGTNVDPLYISFLTTLQTFSLKTAAAENGSISLWSDGIANSTEGTKLSGGTTETPLTYSVPGGKSVTAEITPDFGYEIDTLSVNSQAVEPTRTLYNSDGSVHYELDIPEISSDTSVSVTFKKCHIHKLEYVERTDCFGIDINCTEEDCPWTDSKLTVSANIPDVMRFPKPTLSLTSKDELADETHNAVQAQLSFKSTGENPVEYTEFPNIFGEYTALITITDARDANNVQTYSIAKNFTYEKAELEPGLILSDWTYGEEPVVPRLALSTNPEYARTVYYYKPLDADDSAYTTDFPVNAGQYSVKAVRPETAHYKEGTATSSFRIYQAPSNPVIPTGVTAPYGTKLSDVELPDNWSWDDGEQILGSLGDKTYSATFTPDDAVNYTTVQADINVNATKRPITVTADNKGTFQGNALASLTYTVDGGIVEGDDLGITLDTNANKDVIDTYEITVSASHPNYDITLVNGTYTVSTAPEYSFSDSPEITWTQGSDEDAEFSVICNIENDTIFEKFVGLKIDGVTVAPENYIASKGSVNISLKSDYLDTLSVGEHTVSVLFTDGSAEGTLNILAEAPITDDENDIAEATGAQKMDVTTGTTTPKTGDNAEMYFVLLILSVAGLTATVVFKKRFHKDSI